MTMKHLQHKSYLQILIFTIALYFLLNRFIVLPLLDTAVALFAVGEYAFVLFAFMIMLLHTYKPLNRFLLISLLLISYAGAVYVSASFVNSSSLLSFALLYTALLVKCLYFYVISSSIERTKVNVLPTVSSFVLFVIAFFSLTSFVVAFSMGFEKLLLPLSKWSKGLIDPVLLTNIGILIIVLLLMKVLTGKSIFYVLNKSGLLSLRNVSEGFMVFLIVFVLIHLHIWMYSLYKGFTLISTFSLNEVSFTMWTGGFIAQIFGVGIMEELVFRFIIFWSLYSLITLKRKSVRVVCALLITQVLFSLIHIPIDFLRNPDLNFFSFRPSILLFMGMFFSVLYLYTKNLWIAVFFHGLNNSPMPLIVPYNESVIFLQMNFSYMILVYSLIVVLVMRTVRGWSATGINIKLIEKAS
ncbi:CPBP family intramembrane glutamic endopeptidase [Alkalihalophilus marmarensis]|uniref:CPBP family intramembrane glutamic endopeptidase n=1 Tax=Alkalihalophilus marmarensis TaxID=521377 RepID=UPI002DBD4EDF|nr:CPBP family intramembrane glutamic endopeptidase [Alkalihalophilus marmarensis]MEC2072605.1 CPBP family intramembrane metalloprotease [Alkalihalophilus marmarensis]